MNLGARVRAFFRKGKLDQEMTDEMRTHLELQTDANLQAGMNPEEARHAALRSFGHVEGHKETIRDLRRLPFLETLLQDFGYGLRVLRKSPGFSIVTILTLALGVGAAAAIFTVVNSIILEPLPYRDSGKLYALGELYKGQMRGPFGIVLRQTADEWKRQATSLAEVATSSHWPRTLQGFGPPVRMYAWRVSTNYFSVLGVQPILGRTFRPEEGIEGRGDVLVISHRLWRARFDSRPDIIGQQVRIDDRPYTIIGVLPANFLPAPVTDPAFFAPEPADVDPRSVPLRFLEVDARLKPGVTAAQAERELNAISARLAKEFPKTHADLTAHIEPLLEAKIQTVKPFLWLLLGAVGFLLVIACVNVANLMLARASARGREIAVRIALGASRGRIVSQLLCESLIISIAGSALGVLLAYVGLQALVDMAPLSLPRAYEVSMDGSVLGFSCALAMLTGVGFGLVPALQASRVNPQQAMRDQGRGNSAAGGALRLRSLLVAFEVSLALILLLVAGLLIRSFIQTQRVPLGFQINTCYLAKNILPANRYPTPQSQITFVNRAIESLSSVPGVQDVVYASYFPAFSGNDRNYRIDSRPDLVPENLPTAGYYATTPNYFHALELQLVQGRVLEPRDDADAPPVAVVSQGFVTKYFAGENPIGRRITVLDGATPKSREIVGVVGNVHDFGPTVDRPFQIYVPFAQAPFATPVLLIRVNRPIANLEPALRRALDVVDPEMPLTIVTKLDLAAFVNETIAAQRFALFLFATFSLAALVLSALGIYGVVAYSVTQRTQEIGIRLALGAQARDILRLLFSQTGRMVGAGVVVGLGVALGVTRFVGSLLYQVGTHDPVAYTVVPLFLAGIAAIACWIPARRAIKVDPLTALRHE